MPPKTRRLLTPAPMSTSTGPQPPVASQSTLPTLPDLPEGFDVLTPINEESRTRSGSPVPVEAPGDAEPPPLATTTIPVDPAILFQAIQAMTTLAQANTTRSTAPSTRTEVRKPDPFSGRSPKLVRPFLVQLELQFRDRPAAFPSDTEKINYALTFFTEQALDYVEPYLIGDVNTPEWLEDYELFCGELKSRFGTVDPKGDAETELANLKMKENQRILQYLSKFTQLSTQLQWDDEALKFFFYQGLPDRLKDRISDQGKPKTLQRLKEMAIEMDA